MLSKFFLKALLVAIALTLSACEVTKSLWEDSYQEEFRQFLVSADGYDVAFLSEKYHYVFRDDSGVMKAMLNFDRNKLVVLDEEKTELEIDKSNNVGGSIVLKTFDLNLSPELLSELKALGFRKTADEDLSLKLHVEGKRYLAGEDMEYYNSWLQEVYTIKIHRITGVAGDLEKIALTPVTVAADATLLLKEVVLAPFGE